MTAIPVQRDWDAVCWGSAPPTRPIVTFVNGRGGDICIGLTQFLADPQRRPTNVGKQGTAPPVAPKSLCNRRALWCRRLPRDWSASIDQDLRAFRRAQANHGDPSPRGG